MVPGKLETSHSMGFLEQRVFLLGNGLKITLLQGISDSLRSNRAGDDVVNEIGSLDSIVKLSSSDLLNDRLLVTRRELGRMTSCIVFFVPIYLSSDSANG
jgi:hypothetical protein